MIIKVIFILIITANISCDHVGKKNASKKIKKMVSKFHHKENIKNLRRQKYQIK